MTTGEKVVAGLTAASSRSPVLEVTAPSNALAATDMDMLTVPAGAPEGDGPISLGVAHKNPSLRCPPGEVYEPDGEVPIELTRSGSPGLVPKSNSIGRLAVALTETDVASVGMNHCGEPTTSGRESPLAWEKGASARVVAEFSLGSTKKSSAWSPRFVILTGTVSGVPPASLVPARSGSPGADTRTALKLMLPWKGCDTSSPFTGSAKSTMSVHRPEIGLAA